MKYPNTTEAVFLERPNRFIAKVELKNGCEEIVHVKNTGRCKELLIPNARVILCEGTNLNRKTKYDLIAVYKNNLGWVNIDSQVPNAVMKEWLESGKSIFKNITYIKPEYTYGNSRVDFYIECENRKILIEVKGGTLEIEGKGYFPDAPTQRRIKHIKELQKAHSEGYECYLAFVIAMNGITKVFPNVKTHPEFGEALKNAEKTGVKILHLPCFVSENEIRIKKKF